MLDCKRLATRIWHKKKRGVGIGTCEEMLSNDITSTYRCIVGGEEEVSHYYVVL